MESSQSVQARVARISPVHTINAHWRCVCTECYKDADSIDVKLWFGAKLSEVCVLFDHNNQP